MIDTSGDLLFTAEPLGATFEDASCKDKQFRITGGSNPYAAVRVFLDPDTGETSDAPSCYELSAENSY